MLHAVTEPERFAPSRFRMANSISMPLKIIILNVSTTKTIRARERKGDVGE